MEKLDIELRGLEEARDSMFPGFFKAEPKVTLDTSLVTKEKVDEAQTKLETTVQKNYDAQQDALCRVRCSCCGKEFQIKRWELTK